MAKLDKVALAFPHGENISAVFCPSRKHIQLCMERLEWKNRQPKSVNNCLFGYMEWIDEGRKLYLGSEERFNALVETNMKYILMTAMPHRAA